MAQSKKPQPKRKPLRIKAGDEVIVLTGEGRSKTPRKVVQVFPREGKLLVEGVRLVKDTPRKGQQNSAANQQEFIEKPQPIDASNVALWDAKAKKGTRVRMKSEANGQKTRVAVKSGETL